MTRAAEITYVVGSVRVARYSPIAGEAKEGLRATLSQWVLQWKADPKSPLWNEYGIRLMLPKAGKPAGNTRVPSPSTTTRRYLGGFSEPGSSLHAGTVDDSGFHIFNSIR
jgi:hypothetical protein